MQWHTQASNLTADKKVKIGFTIPGFSAPKIVTWEFHMDDSFKRRYAMILGRDILTALGLNLILFNTSFKEVMRRLKVSYHLWLIWVPMNLYN